MALLASIAVFVVAESYLIFSPVAFQTGTAIDRQMGGLSFGGLTVGAFTARTFLLYGLGIVIALLFIAAYVLYSTQREEYDEGVLY